MIILIWLIVEKATIFFRSNSKFANNPPIRKVQIEMIPNNSLKPKNCKKKNIFIKKKIPAVTKVEECTIAEIGVGADIAAGSQEDTGNWALLVNEQHKTKKHKRKSRDLLKKKIKFGEVKMKQKTSIKITSPKRLKKKVMKELYIVVLLE